MTEKIKPARTESGYMCPICNAYEREYLVQVYRHMALAHNKLDKKSKMLGKEPKVKRVFCCDNPELRLLKPTADDEQIALRLGFVTICNNCYNIEK